MDKNKLLWPGKWRCPIPHFFDYRRCMVWQKNYVYEKKSDKSLRQFASVTLFLDNFGDCCIVGLCWFPFTSFPPHLFLPFSVFVSPCMDWHHKLLMNRTWKMFLIGASLVDRREAEGQEWTLLPDCVIGLDWHSCAIRHLLGIWRRNGV